MILAMITPLKIEAFTPHWHLLIYWLRCRHYDYFHYWHYYFSYWHYAFATLRFSFHWYCFHWYAIILFRRYADISWLVHWHWILLLLLTLIIIIIVLIIIGFHDCHITFCHWLLMPFSPLIDTPADILFSLYWLRHYWYWWWYAIDIIV
jgi:hypothetical protein